ncbi:TadE/TadG family type IV pilus assembly protein [Sinomonas sp. G460-2]|uniref:TadE/TadG family type IV pilus assembly protein n=1 Tax=Sinomonas sp. G460-2 TaxID=3393464 RepID=UPI0039EF756C
MPRQLEPRLREGGSAPTEFVMVGGLLTVFALAIVQLTLVLHVRNTLTDAAASAARYGALGDRGAEDAERRAAELVTMTVGEEFASDISAGEATLSGTRVLEVRVASPLPLVGLAGPPGLVTVTGHAPLS